MRFIKENLILFLILLLAIVVRAFHLGHNSLWVDEAFSVHIAGMGWSRMLHELSLDTHPPLYFFVLHLWQGIFGNSEAAIRSCSVAAGSAAVLAMYLLVKDLFGKKIGLGAAFLMAVNVFQIIYSQEARMYSLLVFLALMSMRFYVRMIWKAGAWNAIFYVVVSVLLLYTHIHAAFVLLAQAMHAAYMLVLKRDDGRRYMKALGCQGLIVLLYSPWLFVLWGQVAERTGDWIPIPTAGIVFEAFNLFSGSIPLLVIFAGLTAVFFISQTVQSLRVEKPIQKSSALDAFGTTPAHGYELLLFWLFATIAIPFLVSQFAISIFRAKYVIAATPAFYILATAGLFKLKNRVVIACLMTIISLLSIAMLPVSEKEQWRTVARYIDNRAQENELLVFNAGFAEYGFNYYSKRKDLVRIPFPRQSLRINMAVDSNNIHELDEVTGGYNRIWIIFSQSQGNVLLIRDKLSPNFKMIEETDFVGVSIKYLERKAPLVDRPKG